MMKVDIQELSDDDDDRPLVHQPAACPKPDKPPAERPAASASVPIEDRVPAATPSPKEPKKKAKAKPKSKGKSKAGAKSGDDDGDTPASATPLKRPAAALVPDGDQEQVPAETETDTTAEMKRPAAAPAKKPKKSEAMRRPAAAAASKPTALKAYKYMYHKEVKFGVKYGGREMVTVRVLSCILCWAVMCLYVSYLSLPLSH